MYINHKYNIECNSCKTHPHKLLLDEIHNKDYNINEIKRNI